MSTSYGSVEPGAPALPPSFVLRRALAACGVVGAWALVASATWTSSKPALSALAVSEPGYAASPRPVSVDQALEACAALPLTPETYRDCPVADTGMWCERMSTGFKSGVLRPEDCETEMCLSMATSECAKACTNEDGSYTAAGWFEPCAWDAMAHVDAFCDGTWEPSLPEDVDAVETGDDDAAYAATKANGADGINDVPDPDALNTCDQKAFCMARGRRPLHLPSRSNRRRFSDISLLNLANLAPRAFLATAGKNAPRNRHGTFHRRAGVRRGRRFVRLVPLGAGAPRRRPRLPALGRRPGVGPRAARRGPTGRRGLRRRAAGPPLRGRAPPARPGRPGRRRGPPQQGGLLHGTPVDSESEDPDFRSFKTPHSVRSFDNPFLWGRGNSDVAH